MIKKRGVVELQFSWIFILIAGALIVAFFVVIVQKQKQVADVKLTSAIRSDLSTILTGGRVSRATASLVEIPPVTIYYDCDGYALGNLGATNPGISFSPDTLKGYGLMMWSLDWNMPFRVENFLYITSPDVRYVFVTDNDENIDTSVFNKIYESDNYPSFPAKTIVQDGEEKILFNKENATKKNVGNSGANSIEDKNNYKVRFIFKNSPEPTDTPLTEFFKDIPNTDVTALNIIRDTAVCTEYDMFDCFGMLQFYQKGGANKKSFDEDEPSFLGESFYLGRASVIAAVFAENPEHYNCQMQRAFRRLSFISELYYDKVTELENYYTAVSNINCQMIRNAKPPLQRIIDNANYLRGRFPDDDITKIDEIYNAMISLKELNNNLQRFSCAEIY